MSSESKDSKVQSCRTATQHVLEEEKAPAAAASSGCHATICVIGSGTCEHKCAVCKAPVHQLCGNILPARRRACRVTGANTNTRQTFRSNSQSTRNEEHSQTNNNQLDAKSQLLAT